MSISINVLLRSEDSNGEVALVRNSTPAGWTGPPLHHHDFDELFYVLEGELTFQLGDEIFTRRAGELAFAPRGAHHTFGNRSEAPAQYLLVITPASFERYFDRMTPNPPATASEPYPETTVVGPPIPA